MLEQNTQVSCFDAIPVIVLSSGGVIVIITTGGCKDGKKDNQSKIFVFNKVFMIFMFKCFLK
jgi:hypothetical protein